MLELRAYKCHDRHVMIKNILDLCRNLYMASYVISVFSSLKSNNDGLFIVSELVNDLDSLIIQPISEWTNSNLVATSFRIIRALYYRIAYLVCIAR